ncbi:MAG: hypothetical protein HY319_17440 [Armatimonadetes bacterium]|nr:hypothetical protein [Armatimonadota bacterium]
MGRMVSIGFALMMIMLAVFLVGVLAGRQPAYPGQVVPYAQFEKEVFEGRYQSATLDGNIVVAHYRSEDLPPVRAIAPDPGRAVEVMLKKGVAIEAARPIPASGLSAPVLVTLLVPYLVLAWFGLTVARAAADAPAPAEPEPIAAEKAPEELPRPRPLPTTVTEEDGSRRRAAAD